MFRFRKRAPLESPRASTADVDARALLARIAWTSAKRLDGFLQGDYRTLFRGAGLMFADLREYTPQDDVRHIDWNVTARMQTPFVRQYEEDRELAAWFVVDLSPSLAFGSQTRTKRLVAAETIAALGHLMTQRGNRVGAIIDRGVDTPEILPARSSRQHLPRILQRVLKAPLADSPGVTNLNAVLLRSARLIQPRSAVFVLSDFYAQTSWDRGLTMLAKRHDVIGIRLIDPLERALPDMGMLTMRDPETGEQVFLDTSDAAFRQRFEAQVQIHEAQLLATLQKAGVDCLELDTESPVHDGLIRFIRQRELFTRTTAHGGQGATRV